MHRKILFWGIVFAFVSVVLGAFGAHALKSILSPEKLQSFETGVRYQIIHALALIALFLYSQDFKAHFATQKSLLWTARFFILGTILFSGSIYGLAILSVTYPNWTFLLGPITPLGGLSFMLGWLNWARLVWMNKVDM